MLKKRTKIKKYRSKRRSTRRYKKHSGGSTIERVEIPFFIERKNKEGPKEVSGVPLVIYRSWMTNSIPKRMNDIIMKSIDKSPGFDNYTYNNEKSLEFIEQNYEPNVANAFKCLKPGAYKSDLWRYCILYKNGGVYSDIKLEIHLPLKDLIEKYSKIFITDMYSGNGPFAIWNGFMASPPGNPVFKSCIDEIVINCKNKDYKEGMLDITGPGLLGRMIEKHEGRDFALNIEFKHKEMNSIYIHYNDTVFLSEYAGYRDDQNNKNTVGHYSGMWTNRDVFDPTIQFE
jgi:mannosyltransferase OCH1-like enzyme